VAKLAEELRTTAADVERRGRRVRGATEAGVADGDLTGLRQQVTALFGEWAKVLRVQPLDKAIAAFLQQLQQAGVLKGEDVMGRTLRLMVELCVERAYAEQAAPAAAAGPQASGAQEAIEAYAKLAALLVRSAQDNLPLRLAVAQRVRRSVFLGCLRVVCGGGDRWARMSHHVVISPS
jgi:hypothetical protein